MRHLRMIEKDKATFVRSGLRVLLLSDGADLAAKHRLADFGARVDTETEVFTALASMMDDPSGYGLFVMDTDAFGGISSGMRAFQMLRAADVRLPVILVAADCGTQVFPEERSAPILLKAPLSMVSLRVGFEHALHDRVIWRAA